MKHHKLLKKWRKTCHWKKSNWKKPQTRPNRCWRNSKSNKDKLKKSKRKSVWLPPSVKEKLLLLRRSKKKPKDNWLLPFLPKWEPRLPLTHWMLQVSIKWKPTRSHQKLWNWHWMLWQFISTWNWLRLQFSMTCKSQEEQQLTSGRTVLKRAVSSFWVQVLTFWRTWRLMIRTQSVQKLSSCWSPWFWQVQNGSTKPLPERCQRQSPPFANGCLLFTSIMKNPKSSSQKESNWPWKKLTCQLPRKNFKNPEKNLLLSLTS